MFFKFSQQTNILRVDDSFASLEDVSVNGDMTFEFRYRVKQSEVVKKKAITCQVSVISKTVPVKRIIEQTNGQIDTKKLVENILKHVPDSKALIKEQNSYVVASRMSDISAKINNEIIPMLRAGTPPNLIPSLRRSKLTTVPAADVKQDNEIKPLLQFIAHRSVSDKHESMSSSLEASTRRLMHDMIVKQGIDPSFILNLTHRSLAAHDVRSGIVRKTKVQEQDFDLAVQLLHYYVFHRNASPFNVTTNDVSDNTYVSTLTSEVFDEVEVPVIIVMPKSRRIVGREEQSHFLVRFDLIDSETKAIIDTITKPLDTARHVQLYHTPRKAPIVNVYSSEITTRASLEIKQVDHAANAVAVYKKNFSRVNVEVDDYSLVGTYNLSSRQQALTVAVDKPMYSPLIYRVIPLGENGVMGNEYTNVVVKPSRYHAVKSISLSARTVETGIEVEGREIPMSVVSVEILKRNLTRFEKTFSNVGGVILIDDPTRESDYFSVIDSEVSDRNIYEYVARLIYRNGTSENAGTCVIEQVTSIPGKVDLLIENLEVSHDSGEPNVTFTIHSNIVNNDIDVIKTLLQRQDIKEFFNDDLLREREFMKGLVAHAVQRVDLTTGVREDFGVVTDEVFNDKESQKNNAVSPLRYGHKYRYEVSTLIRSPETLFETFEKQKTDVVTKKPYQFKPSKFLHPVTLREGNVVTTAGLHTRYSKSALAHGAIGTFQSVEVSFDSEPARVINPTASRFDNDLNVITWKLEGSIDQVDHFLVIKDVHGVRTIVGKAHSEFPFGNVQYLHQLNNKDEGELKYVIVPIFNDYTIGDEVISNSVIV